MNERNKGEINEKQLWHGTMPDHVESICHQSFDWRLYSTHAYGKGSYFAKDASFSQSYSQQDSNGKFSMFYADVLVGFSTRVGYQSSKQNLKL